MWHQTFFQGIGGAKIIAAALKDNQTLHTVVMGRNRMESEGAIILSNSLSQIKTLKVVKLPQNSIRPDGIHHVCETLAELSLEHLDLQDNTFTESGCDALVLALNEWPKLRVLNVGECLLGAKGSIKVIKKLLLVCNDLEELYFSYNEMDLKGAQLIPDMLKGKKKLLKLELNGNTFDGEDEIVDEIRSILSANGFPGGLDELDDMEEVSDEEDDDDDEELSNDQSQVHEDDASDKVDGSVPTSEEDSVPTQEKINVPAKEENNSEMKKEDASLDDELALMTSALRV